MRGSIIHLTAGMLLVCTTGANARSAMSPELGGAPNTALPGTLECVPYARDTSGIRIYGDAHTWWSQAAGKYARGSMPKPGAVLAIRPHGNSTLGHVATVSRVIDARTILISHANWSSPGQIERNVAVTDASPANDWSQVRVWYAPIHNLGAARWPVAGFIYNAKPGTAGLKVRPDKAHNVSPRKTGATLTRFVAPRTTLVRFGAEPAVAASVKNFDAPLRARSSKMAPAKAASARMTGAKTAAIRFASAVQKRKDPIGAIIAGVY